jgi:ankyrin repeat protein
MGITPEPSRQRRQRPLGINSPIANAIHNGHKSVVELLVNFKAKVDAWAYITDPTWYTSSPLIVGANAGDVEIFELLVRKGASLVRTSEHRYENLPQRALCDAARRKHYEICRIIWQKCKPVAIKTETNEALHETINGRNHSIVRLLVESGWDVQFIAAA